MIFTRHNFCLFWYDYHVTIVVPQCTSSPHPVF